MGACCGGMGTGEQKSLPESQKVNNVDETEKCVNGLKGDAKETPADVTAEHTSPDHEAPANANHTEDHTQPSTASPDHVELKITEPDRSEPEAAAPVAADKPDVCPEHPPPPAPDTQPTEVPVMSKNDDVARENESSVTEMTTTTTTTQVEHTQMSSSTTETTEVRTTTTVEETPTSTDATSKDEEQQKVGDVKLVKLGDDVASAPVEMPPVTAEVDFSPAETTAGTDDHQKQADAIVEESVGEVVQAASTAGEQEPAALPSAEQVEQVSVPDVEVPSHETAIPADTAPAATEQPDPQHQDELQLPTATAPEINDAPTATAYTEPGMADEAKHEETSAEAGEQPEQPQQIPAAADNVAATSEQQTGIADVEVPRVAVEALVDADATAVAHEEPSPATEEQPKAVEETNAENTAASEASGPVVDDSASKPDEPVSTAQDAFGDIHPEELPPPLTPEKEDAATAATAYHEEDRQAPATDGYVEPTTETFSEQPDQRVINDSINNVEEPTPKPNTEAADQAVDMPVEGEP